MSVEPVGVLDDGVLDDGVLDDGVLDGVLDVLDGARGAAISASDQQVRALAEEILSQPKYAQFRSGPTASLADLIDEWLSGLRDLAPDWLVAAWDWLRDLVRWAWDSAGPEGELSLGPAEWIVGAMLVALLLAVAVAVGRSLRASRVPVESRTSKPGGTGRALLAEADALASAEHFLEAAQRTQLAALQLMLERRWLELARSDANRVLRQRIERTPLPESLCRRFVGLLDRLESQWFRDRTEDRELYLAWRRLHAEIEHLDARLGAPPIATTVLAAVVATGAQ